MRFWHKAVSTGVLAAVVLLPFLSIAMCVPEDAGSMQCPPDCPMMAKMSHDGMQMSPSEDPGSCCHFKSSRPAPTTESQTVAPTVSVEPTVASAPLSPPSKARTIAAVDTSPPLRCDHQAQLCTFLI